MVGNNLSGNIKNCYSTLKVNSDMLINPFIGYCSGDMVIENCANISGFIIGSIESGNVELKNCISIGDINVTLNSDFGDTIGGIVNSSLHSQLSIQNCYFKGKMNITTELEDYKVGGIIGETNDNVTVTDSKYLEKSIYVNNVLQADDEYATTEEAMNTYVKNILEVINTDGAFKQDSSNINNGYPILSWQ